MGRDSVTVLSILQMRVSKEIFGEDLANANANAIDILYS
jgi:hypothetical protein